MNLNQNIKLFIHENTPNHIVCEMAVNLLSGGWVNNIYYECKGSSISLRYHMFTYTNVITYLHWKSQKSAHSSMHKSYIKYLIFIYAQRQVAMTIYSRVPLQYPNLLFRNIIIIKIRRSWDRPIRHCPSTYACNIINKKVAIQARDPYSEPYNLVVLLYA